MDCGAFPLRITPAACIPGPAARRCWPPQRPATGWPPTRHFGAASYRSVISDRDGAAWLGPFQVTMTAPST